MTSCTLTRQVLPGEEPEATGRHLREFDRLAEDQFSTE